MTSNSVGLPIGAAAERFSIAPHVLRHWEAVGLLRPGRTADDRRRYHPDDLARIAVILRAKEAGLALDDIRHILRAEPRSRRRMLQQQRAMVADRIERDRARLAVLDCVLACEHEDQAGCPHFQQAISERRGTP